MPKRDRGRPPHDDILTPAEWRVLHSAQHGMSKRAIAERLHVSQDAIKYHLRNIREKLGVSTKAELGSIFLKPKHSGVGMSPEQRSDIGRALDIQGRIGQISRTVSNLEQSADWFEVVLELPRLMTFPDMVFFDCDGTRLMLTTNAPLNENESILYFQVGNMEASHQALTAKGVEFINVPHRLHVHEDGTEEWLAFFRDPDGRPLALICQLAGKASEAGKG